MSLFTQKKEPSLTHPRQLTHIWQRSNLSPSPPPLSCLYTATPAFLLLVPKSCSPPAASSPVPGLSARPYPASFLDLGPCLSSSWPTRPVSPPPSILSSTQQGKQHAVHPPGQLRADQRAVHPSSNPIHFIHFYSLDRTNHRELNRGSAHSLHSGPFSVPISGIDAAPLYTASISIVVPFWRPNFLSTIYTGTSPSMLYLLMIRLFWF